MNPSVIPDVLAGLVIGWLALSFAALAWAGATDRPEARRRAVVSLRWAAWSALAGVLAIVVGVVVLALRVV